MRTSHQEVRKRIMEEKSKISDEEFFCSRAYQAHLADITEAATKRYKKPLKVVVFADSSDDTVAYTDYDGVYINACNRITASMPSRRLKSLSIEGFNAHENAHNLFTDNRIWCAFYRKMEKGKFYPKQPTKLSSQEKISAQEILDALVDETDEIPKMVIETVAHALSNILEDGYVDARYSHEFPGMPASGIALNNLRFAEQVPDINTMIDNKFCDHNIVLNLLIQYVRAGEVNNLSGYTGEYLDALNSVVPYVDECLFDEDTRSRCESANRILITLWPMMKRCFDEVRKNYQNQPSNASGGSGQGTASNSQAAKEALEQQISNGAPNAMIKTSPAPSSGSAMHSKGEGKELKAQIQRVLAEETTRIAQHLSSGIEDGDGDGSVSFCRDYEGGGYEFAQQDIERILTSIAEERVYQREEHELSEALQREAESISYGNAHQGIDIEVNRMSSVNPEFISQYNAVAPKLLELSKRLQRSVKAVLQDKRQGGKQTGLIVGKRLNQHALYRDDGKVFCNTRLPTEPINLAVGLLIDESGSMAGEDRITRARATAIVVQDFCEKLGIPIMIVGHTASCKHVKLFSYSEFDSVDRKDRYRLMDMSARCCNRDGAALRYVAEKLRKHPADAKMLIIICDGQPNDDGYHGSAAEADLRGIKLEYSRKGVQIYAAAIGDDRENIERIYGSGYLNITDLSQLPVMLTKLISQSLPK